MGPLKLLFRSCSVLLLAHAIATACSCGGNATYCSGFEEVSFVGKVTVGSGEGWGTGPATVIVEEVLRGLSPSVSQLTVDSMAGSSCHVPLKTGERYVVYAARNPGDPNRVATGGCSFTFPVRGNEHLLTAVRNAAHGGPSMLVGKVSEKTGRYSVSGSVPAGIPVQATQGKEVLQTRTNANGEFLFTNVPPGKYHLTVKSDQYVEDEFRFPAQDPEVPPQGCAYQYLAAWPNIRIEGTVRGVDGTPLPDVSVQAFGVDQKGEVESWPVQTAITNADGKYVLAGLPQGEVVVAVNGERYRDKQPWKPTFYPGTPDVRAAERLTPTNRIGEIDLALAPPRQAATLHISAVFEDGRPAAGFFAKIRDLSGAERGSVMDKGDKKSTSLTLATYQGETYRVEASYSESFPIPVDGKGVKGGYRSWRGISGPVQIDNADVHVRIVLLIEKSFP